MDTIIIYVLVFIKPFNCISDKKKNVGLTFFSPVKNAPKLTQCSAYIKTEHYTLETCICFPHDSNV